MKIDLSTALSPSSRDSCWFTPKRVSYLLAANQKVTFDDSDTAVLRSHLNRRLLLGDLNSKQARSDQNGRLTEG